MRLLNTTIDDENIEIKNNTNLRSLSFTFSGKEANISTFVGINYIIYEEIRPKDVIVRYTKEVEKIERMPFSEITLCIINNPNVEVLDGNIHSKFNILEKCNYLICNINFMNNKTNDIILSKEIKNIYIY
jgi:hypothetical protein